MELEGTPGAYRLRYELPVASVGPVKKNAVKICDWNENTNNYKHDSTGQGAERLEMGDGDWERRVCGGGGCRGGAVVE